MYKNKNKNKIMKKNDFKLNFVDNTTFTGIDAEGFYAEALLTGTSKNLFKLIPNVKSKIKLGELQIGDILNDADCSFSSNGDTTLNQKSFEVSPIKINLEYCQRTFEVNYLSLLLRPGSNSDEIVPPTVESFLLDQVAKKVSADTEQMVWKSNHPGFPFYPNNIAGAQDGIILQLENDATVVDVVGIVLDATNIIAELGRVYDAILPQLLDADDMRIMVPSTAFRFYRQALAAASAEAYFMQNYTELSFLNVRMVEVKGLPDNMIVASKLSNLVLLTDLLSDFEDIQILPQKSVTGVPVVRLIGEFKIGQGYIFGSEVIFYH